MTGFLSIIALFSKEHIINSELLLNQQGLTLDFLVVTCPADILFHISFESEIMQDAARANFGEGNEQPVTPVISSATIQDVGSLYDLSNPSVNLYVLMGIHICLLTKNLMQSKYGV